MSDQYYRIDLQAALAQRIVNWAETWPPNTPASGPFSSVSYLPASAILAAGAYG